MTQSNRAWHIKHTHTMMAGKLLVEFCVLEISINLWWNFNSVGWSMSGSGCVELTHWGYVTHICISKIIIIHSDNGLLPGRPQAIIWTNSGILLIGPLGINFGQISIKINTFHSKMKMLSAKWHLFCLCFNELISVFCGFLCQVMQSGLLAGSFMVWLHRFIDMKIS